MPEPDSARECPTCQGELTVRTLECADCGTRVELPRGDNEFAALDAEMLHLLRIFVLCEGRIRDMEAALGVSYPTVKSRLGKLREALRLAGAPDDEPAASDTPPGPDTAAAILAQLEAGAISYDEALTRIRALKRP